MIYYVYILYMFIIWCYRYLWNLLGILVAFFIRVPAGPSVRVAGSLILPHSSKDFYCHFLLQLQPNLQRLTTLFVKVPTHSLNLSKCGCSMHGFCVVIPKIPNLLRLHIRQLGQTNRPLSQWCLTTGRPQKEKPNGLGVPNEEKGKDY